MNVRTRRGMARAGVGALALLATGTLVALAGPAYAAASLAVNVESSKIAIGSPVKPFIAKITNSGDTAARGLQVEIDLSGLDASAVQASIGADVAGACEPPAQNTITCNFDDTLSADGTFELPISLTPVVGAQPGSAGQFTVTVRSGSATPATATAPVELVAPGGDIVVLAEDVVAGVGANGQVKPVAPGHTAEFDWTIYNFGDTAVQGLTFTVELPEHVSFAAKFDGCRYGTGARTVTCTDAEAVLAPADAFGPLDPWTVKVAADAPGPVNLRGVAVAEASGTVEEPQIFSAPASSPKAQWLRSEKSTAKVDVDKADNTDDFRVFIGAAAGAGNGAGGGSLPVTGVRVGLIAGIGAAVLAVGAVLFVFARRRRVVPVTPGDETPTA